MKGLYYLIIDGYLDHCMIIIVSHCVIVKVSGVETRLDVHSITSRSMKARWRCKVGSRRIAILLW